MKLKITEHAIERIDERLTNSTPELKDLQRLEKLIRRSGKWFLNDDGSYYCFINNLIVCIFQLTGDELVMVTTYPHTQSMKSRKMQFMTKIDVVLEK